jgi:hypothetical protein
MARVRSNRAQRRRAQRGRQHPHIPLAEAPGILPGLPGGAPYNTEEARAAVMDEVMAAVRELHPGDEQRRQEQERLGITGYRRQRYKRADSPTGGQGVVLGEFEDDRPELPPMWREGPGGAVIFE